MMRALTKAQAEEGKGREREREREKKKKKKIGRKCRIQARCEEVGCSCLT